eukprot:CAMPEP_0194077440 /NCGR_PEP_ID=MMETSP0149-20130528/4063_1 /TAXON_ID=122233 /ORGANISM="Chaetoceros debilis, Strain MM31A-1" /LENGTH=409 /DNA_ID=CAMNT_0038758463 /DNA_START=644 /DNA_END=1873 /DNA_ORIENTATION=-
MVFVHLGKTAGSSITCMLHPSLYKSGKGNSQCDNNNNSNNYQPSAISNIVNKRIHLEPAIPIPIPPVEIEDEHTYEYDDFLITVRNPIERIVSWFYYIHPSYPPRKSKRHINGCDGYSTIFQCWNTIQDMAEYGLRRFDNFDVSDVSYVNVSSATDTSKTETNSNRNSTTDTTDTNTTSWTNSSNSNSNSRSKSNSASKSDCQWLAQELVLGTRKCWHNSYNYNFTYGGLLQEAEATSMSVSVSTSTSASASRRNITIYAIRTEHLEEDWGVIDRMLGGDNSDVKKPLRKNSWGKQGGTGTGTGTGKSSSSSKVADVDMDMVHGVPNKTLSYAGRLNLCHALCNEIQIYKQLLHLAINIDHHRENESLDELIATCPDERREIRDCPLIRVLDHYRDHYRDHDHDLDGVE